MYSSTTQDAEWKSYPKVRTRRKPPAKGGAVLKEKIETTFESIESAHEFVTLLAQTVAQAKRDIQGDVAREQKAGASRRLDALRLSIYTLEKLELHMKRTCRALNDLRALQRLLFEERGTRKLQSTGNRATGAN